MKTLERAKLYRKKYLEMRKLVINLRVLLNYLLNHPSDKFNSVYISSRISMINKSLEKEKRRKGKNE